MESKNKMKNTSILSSRTNWNLTNRLQVNFDYISLVTVEAKTNKSHAHFPQRVNGTNIVIFN